MADWVRTQYDQLHSLEAQLTDADGPLNIPPGTSVSFVGRLLGQESISFGGTAVVVRADAEADDPNRGFVRYDLTSNDMATPGLFFCRWKVVPPNSAQTQSFPEDGELTLLILQSV